MKLSKNIFFLCVFAFMGLQGGVKDHFKPALDKQGDHSMRNVDFIYMINLDRRPEKFQQCQNELNPYGIYPYRFSAVNGWELSLEEVDSLGVEYAPWMQKKIMGTYYPIDGDGSPVLEEINVIGKRYFSHCLSRGAVGILLSHFSILQDAYDAGYETIWVMEDDIQVLQDPHQISVMIDRLDQRIGKTWDILFTDQDTKNQRGEYVPCRGYAQRPNFYPANPGRFHQEPTSIGEDFKKINARYGAYSMIIRRCGMKKLLDFIKMYKLFLPYDMEFYLPNNIKLYAVTRDIVSTMPNALSDNGSPYYMQTNEQ